METAINDPEAISQMLGNYPDEKLQLQPVDSAIRNVAFKKDPRMPTQ